MLPLAEWKFKDEYTFAFEKDPLMYKNKNLPDALQGTITPVAQLCSITEGSDIDGFIDTVLLRWKYLLFLFKSMIFMY